MKLIISSVLLILSISTITKSAPTEEGDGLEFIILHNNDMHARFDETDKNSNLCKKEDADSKKCYGGMARTSYLIKKYRAEHKSGNSPPVLYLNAGDSFSGTVWFTILKEKVVSEMMNLLEPNAMCLGNHEFDKGVKGLVTFLEKVKFPVVVSNLGLDKEPTLKAISNLKSSTILEVAGKKIGVIGYLTPDTLVMSSAETVEIYPEIEYVNKEAEKLKAQGIDIIIALGHSGFEKDKEIALNCPDLDLIIGGHTNTFLYNGDAPDIEKPQGPYPFVVTQKSGKKVPVVQAYAYTKYLGKILLKFNGKGDLTSWEGNPILLDHTIEKDPEVAAVVESYRAKISAIGDEVIGHTKSYLNGTRPACRKGECTVGNLLADSFVYARQKQLGGTTDAEIAFIQAGSIRDSIPKKEDGAITNNDVLAVMPFNNTLYVVTLKGEQILKALELSADNYERDRKNGGFLQMSGLGVTYDMSKPSGHRVVSTKVKCSECDKKNPYAPIEESKEYKVILSEFLLKGGDGHKWSDSADPLQGAIKMPISDYQAVLDYIREKSPLDYKPESRIVVM